MKIVQFPAININFPIRCSFVYIRTLITSNAEAFGLVTPLIALGLEAGLDSVGFSVSAVVLGLEAGVDLVVFSVSAAVLGLEAGVDLVVFTVSAATLLVFMPLWTLFVVVITDSLTAFKMFSSTFTVLASFVETYKINILGKVRNAGYA